jgi:hypothetical protein
MQNPVSGNNRQLLHSMVKTCRGVFPQVRAFRPRPEIPEKRVQNIMLVCMKDPQPVLPLSASPEIKKMLQQEIDLSGVGIDKGIVLTDDFAPVEYYTEKLLDSYFMK